MASSANGYAVQMPLFPQIWSRRASAPSPSFASQPSAAQWELRLPSGEKKSIPSDGTVFRVGRSDESDGVLSSVHVSRNHLEVRVFENRLQVRDVGSLNGTWMGEQRLDPGCWQDLEGGERLHLGVKGALTCTLSHRGGAGAR